MREDENQEVRIFISPWWWPQRKGIPGTQSRVLRRRMAGKALVFGDEVFFLINFIGV